jgi:hypothetical protein
VYTKVDKEDLKRVIDAYHPRRLSKTERAPGASTTLGVDPVEALAPRRTEPAEVSGAEGLVLSVVEA